MTPAEQNSIDVRVNRDLLADYELSSVFNWGLAEVEKLPDGTLKIENKERERGARGSWAGEALKKTSGLSANEWIQIAGSGKFGLKLEGVSARDEYGRSVQITERREIDLGQRGSVIIKDLPEGFEIYNIVFKIPTPGASITISKLRTVFEQKTIQKHLHTIDFAQIADMLTFAGFAAVTMMWNSGKRPAGSGNLPEKEKAAPLLNKVSGIVIGIPKDTPQNIKTSLRKTFGRRTIVTVPDAEMLLNKLNALKEKGKNLQGLFIDKASLESGIGEKEINATMLETTYKGILSISGTDEEGRKKIAALIEAMLPLIKSMSAAEIFASKEMGELRAEVINHLDLLSAIPSYNDTTIFKDALSMEKKGSVTITEKAALSNPAFAKGVKRILEAGGNVNFVYGEDFTEEQAGRFLEENKLNIASIGLINKLDEQKKPKTLDMLEKEINSKLPSDIDAKNTAIVIAPKEIEGNTNTMKVLELKEETINGYKVILGMNTEKVAYVIALDGVVQGLVYNDNTKRYTYLPPIVSIYVGQEVDTYRRAMILLSSAA